MTSRAGSSTGLARNWSAPSLTARTARSIVAWPVSTTTGTVASISRRRGRRSRAVPSGSMWSRTTASGCQSRTTRSAEAMVSASSTSRPSLSRKSRTPKRIPGSSSTIRIFGKASPAPARGDCRTAGGRRPAPGLGYHRPVEAEPRRRRAGEVVDDLCRACHAPRDHTVIAVDGEGRPLRVQCGFCGSQHNYRGGADETPPARSARVSSERPAGPALRPRGGPRKDRRTHDQRREHGGTGEAAPPDHPRGVRPHARRSGGQVAGRAPRPAPRQPRPPGEELADRDLLPQGRDAAQPPAHPGAAAQRVRPARRPEGPPAELRDGLLRDASRASTSSSPTRTTTSAARAAASSPRCPVVERLLRSPHRGLWIYRRRRVARPDATSART